VNTNKSTALFSANEFLRGIAEGEFRSFEYTSLNGEKLTGWMLLPYGYTEGRSYPLLTWVYAGSVYNRRPGDYWGINSKLSLNLQIPAAHGYVVLLPSMPLAKEGLTDDPMLRLPEGVLPAVQKVVDMGIADPDRLFLMGQSFGGFSTYGLVTQTQRFKAAISLAGMSDLVSLYGLFDARSRYTDFPQENLFQSSLIESSQVRMGNPPWKDWGRYTRNSPIFYVDRVQTPLMIIQGDMDYVSMQQGEEFFMSLYRQGKRAEFVRYWGEGHVLQSPANICDMWSRIFAWFDEFSPKNGASPANTAAAKPR
jgi:dipeptidyl aminopeptidase/acylaminoacyl peptidase